MDVSITTQRIELGGITKPIAEAHLTLGHFVAEVARKRLTRQNVRLIVDYLNTGYAKP